MAGMLPGVESARRRRFHNSSNLTSHELSSSTWRSYTTTTHHFHSNSSSTRSSLIRQQGLYGDDDESRLSAAAIQAKKRLDLRLHLPHTHRIDQSRSMNIDREQERPTRSSNINRPPPTNIHQLNVQDDNQVPNKLKKSGSKRLNWLKLSWKSSEQDECAVCLEQFVKAGGKSGGTLMQLPCGHRFHTNCLMPWLEANAHCPCCRMDIPSSKQSN